MKWRSNLAVPQVVIADLGCCVMSEPNFRMQKRLRIGDCDLRVCTINYRPPDVCLGDQRYGDEFDIWSLGCVAAELVTGLPLFHARTSAAHVKEFVDAIFKLLGPPEDSTWLESLPYFQRWYGKTAATAGLKSGSRWPPQSLEGCPKGLIDFIRSALQWQPKDRMSIAAAKSHPFLEPPGRVLMVRLEKVAGKKGVGTIAETHLDPDLLRYLQECPGLKSLALEFLQKGEVRSHCVRKDEAELGNKQETAGIVDEEHPPKCNRLNNDKDLQPLPSKRFAAFVRAVRIEWRPWLQQLTQKMRTAVDAQHMPKVIQDVNGGPIMDEEFADNAFAYASIQVMKPGKRNDGWHTDGGCSLLHASVTLFGARSVQVRSGDMECKCKSGVAICKCGLADVKEVQLLQVPGSFYVGTLVPLNHNVHHYDEPPHLFHPIAETAQGHGEADAAQEHGGAATADGGLEIAVMIRSDVFRNCRARTIDSTPGPVDFFQVVNTVVAEHLAEVPVRLPDLTAVLKEAARAELVSGGLTD